MFMDLGSRDPLRALEEIANGMSSLYPRPACDLGNELKSWYERGSPGVSRGVVFPHARCTGIGENAVCIARSREGVDLSSPGGQDVARIFATVLSPAADHTKHLAVLARAARILRNEPVISALLTVKGPSEMEAVFEEADETAESEIPKSK